MIYPTLIFFLFCSITLLPTSKLFIYFWGKQFSSNGFFDVNLTSCCIGNSNVCLFSFSQYNIMFHQKKTILTVFVCFFVLSCLGFINFQLQQQYVVVVLTQGAQTSYKSELKINPNDLLLCLRKNHCKLFSRLRGGIECNFFSFFCLTFFKIQQYFGPKISTLDL